MSLDDATAGISVDGMTGLRDEDLSSDGRFLYVIDADGGRIYGWSVGAEGSLEPVGSWDEPSGDSGRACGELRLERDATRADLHSHLHDAGSLER